MTERRSGIGRIGARRSMENNNHHGGTSSIIIIIFLLDMNILLSERETVCKQEYFKLELLKLVRGSEA